jgi:hypothetical protein
MGIYIIKNHLRQGPFAHAEIVKMIQTGRMAPDDLCCVDDGADAWAPFSTLFPKDASGQFSEFPQSVTRAPAPIGAERRPAAEAAGPGCLIWVGGTLCILMAIAALMSLAGKIDWTIPGYIAFFGLALLVFLIPSFVAVSRKHPHWRWIVAANIIFGGTGLGWLACFCWAYWKPNPQFAIPVRIDSGQSSSSDGRNAALQLDELMRLKQAGLITEEECEEKRAAVLSKFG